MKYSISLILLISGTMHAGSCLSRPKQSIPLQYIHITATLSDSNTQAALYTGKYSYVDFGDRLTPANRPSQPHSGCVVNIESANLSFPQDTQPQPVLKTTLSLIYSVQERAGANFRTIQKPETATFNFLDQNDTILERTFPDASYTLKILAKHILVPSKE